RGVRCDAATRSWEGASLGGRAVRSRSARGAAVNEVGYLSHASRERGAANRRAPLRALRCLETGWGSLREEALAEGGPRPAGAVDSRPLTTPSVLAHPTAPAPTERRPPVGRRAGGGGGFWK